MKTLRDMKVGDIIVNEDGDKRKVLAVLGEVFLPSFLTSYDAASASWYTFAEAERDGWKLEGDEADCQACADYYEKAEKEAAEEAIKTLERLGKIKDGRIVNE